MCRSMRLGVCCVLSLCVNQWAETTGRAAVTVGRSAGHLAVAESPGARWAVLSPGDTLPGDCMLRTSPVGPCKLELGPGVLHAGPETRLQIDSEQSKLTIHAGRILLQSSKDHWQLQANEIVLRCAERTEIDLSVAGDGKVAGRLMGGQVRIGQGNKTVKGPASFTVGADGEVQVTPQEESGWAEQVRAWTVAPRPAQGLGQLVIRDAQADSPKRLEIARYHVNVVLQPPVALVQIDQSFYDPYWRQEEGTFVFNLPPGASVSRFAMFVTRNSLIEGELIERKRASDIYESIVRARRDPAILEQIGDSLFKMRVFPIFARDTKRILLDYTVPLVAEGGRYRFELPLLSDLEPIWDFRIQGTVLPPLDPRSVKCPSHRQMTFERRDDGAVTFDLRAKDFQPTANLAVEFRDPEKQPVRVRSFTTRRIEDVREGRQHFMITLPPLAAAPAEAQPAPADVLVLADTSGSTRTLRLLRQAVRTVVRNLRPADRFRLGCVDVDHRPLTDGWLKPESPAAGAALEAFDKQFALGATDLGKSILGALKAFNDSPDERRRLIVYVGDGVSTQSRLGERSLIDGLDDVDATVVAIQLRDDAAGRRFLRKMARATGGRVFDTGNNAEALVDVFDWVLSGMPEPATLTSVQVAGVAEEDQR